MSVSPSLPQGGSVLVVKRIDVGMWGIQELHRDLDGMPVWSEYRTEPPPAMQGKFTLTEAMRVCILNLHPGENMMAAVSANRVVAITPFFIQPDDVRAVVGGKTIGPYQTAEELAGAVAGVAYIQLGFLE